MCSWRLFRGVECPISHHLHGEAVRPVHHGVLHAAHLESSQLAQIHGLEPQGGNQQLIIFRLLSII